MKAFLCSGRPVDEVMTQVKEMIAYDFDENAEAQEEVNYLTVLFYIQST